MKEYRWHGHTYQIADEDLENYPGAVPVKAKTEAPKAAEKGKSAAYRQISEVLANQDLWRKANHDPTD